MMPRPSPGPQLGAWRDMMIRNGDRAMSEDSPHVVAREPRHSSEVLAQPCRLKHSHRRSPQKRYHNPTAQLHVPWCSDHGPDTSSSPPGDNGAQTARKEALPTHATEPKAGFLSK